jgi:hypothetical protein
MMMTTESKIDWLPINHLQRHIYGLKGKSIDVFTENSSLAINPHYIQSWLDLLSRTPRVTPFLQKNNPFIAALKKAWPLTHSSSSFSGSCFLASHNVCLLVQELSEQTTNVHVQNDALDGLFTFYDATKATLNVYQVCKRLQIFVVFVHAITGQVNIENLNSLLP